MQMPSFTVKGGGEQTGTGAFLLASPFLGLFLLPVDGRLTIHQNRPHHLHLTFTCKKNMQIVGK